jgi:hypothetical protein
MLPTHDDSPAIITQCKDMPTVQIVLNASEKAEELSPTDQPRDDSDTNKQSGLRNDDTDAAVSTEKSDGIRDGGVTITTTPDYPRSWKLLVIVAALCLAVFLVALDQTIVAVATPKITDHFDSLDDVGWCVCCRH